MRISASLVLLAAVPRLLTAQATDQGLPWALLAGMAIFIEYPILAAGLAIVLFGLGWRLRRRVAVGVGALWLLYALYELGMKRRWLCSGECNIRIDLLLIYPVLALGLIVAAVSLLRARRGTTSPS